MITSFIYIIFAILGLSFLIFIHELGHYYMARRVGMRVETFSIGFGKPIYQWEHDGVKWQIGWLLFGGFVKIAGTDTDSKQDPYLIPDGFFGKSPWDRIKVAFMGPLVNLIFAIVAFSLLWVGGGRAKKYSEFTPKLGWVDQKSELYTKGIRPGDEITQYNDHDFESYKDHIFASLFSPDELKVKGNKVDYLTGEKEQFNYEIHPYPHPYSLESDRLTTGIIQPANYVIYDHLPDGKENPLPEGSPMVGSGIQYGDRVLWVDGELIFSDLQLSNILNDDRVLVTVSRGAERLLRRVPRVKVQELKPDSEFREELIDWQFEAGLNQIKTPNLFTIPYNITYDGVVENRLKYIDVEAGVEAFPTYPFSEMDEPLQPGDQIIAVNGIPVQYSYDLITQLQNKMVNIIVQRDPKTIIKEDWRNAVKDFYQNVKMDDLELMARSIGTASPVSNVEGLYLLKPVEPMKRKDFKLTDEKKAWVDNEKKERMKAVQQIEDPEKRSQIMQLLEEQENQFLLGIPLVQDRQVTYNPDPIHLFFSVFSEIWRTLTALLTGTLSPKGVVGPIGIVHVVQSTWMVSLKEVLFWLGAISLNLGVLNLLPIPVLDGGTIVLSFFEMITGKQLKPKTMEKLIIPFAVLIFIFFLYISFQDINRIFGNFLHW